MQMVIVKETTPHNFPKRPFSSQIMKNNLWRDMITLFLKRHGFKKWTIRYEASISIIHLHTFIPQTDREKEKEIERKRER